MNYVVSFSYFSSIGGTQEVISCSLTDVLVRNNVLHIDYMSIDRHTILLCGYKVSSGRLPTAHNRYKIAFGALLMQMKKKKIFTFFR